jgi:hypothetical protein
MPRLRSNCSIHASKNWLALEQRLVTQILAIDQQKIEGIEREPVMPAGRQVRLQLREVGRPAF